MTSDDDSCISQCETQLFHILNAMVPQGTLRTLNLTSLVCSPECLAPDSYLFTGGGQFVRVHGQAFQIFRYGLKVSDFPQH